MMGMIFGKSLPIWQGIQDILFWCCVIFLSSSKDFKGLRLGKVGVLQVLGEIRSSGLTQKEILPTKVLKYLIMVHSYRPWDKIKPMIFLIFQSWHLLHLVTITAFVKKSEQLQRWGYKTHVHSRTNCWISLKILDNLEHFVTSSI